MTENVLFNIASEASYVYFLSGPMVHFGEILKTCSLRSNSVTRQVIGTKIVENAETVQFKSDILGNFQTMWGECMSLYDAKCSKMVLKVSFEKKEALLPRPLGFQLL